MAQKREAGRGTPRRRAGRTRQVETLENRTLLSAVSWVAGASGDFDTGSNWSTGVVPGPGDDVTISAGPAITIVHSAGNDTVHSITTNSPIDLTGGQLTVSTTLDVTNGSLLMDGGTLAGASVVGSSNVAFNTTGGILSGVTADAGLTLASNSAKIDIENGLTLTSGSFTLAANNQIVSFGGTQSFGGSLSFAGTGDQLSLDSGANLTLSGGSISGNSAAIGASPDSTETLVNNGSITSQTAGQTLDVQAPNFTNTGVITAISGGAATISSTQWSNTGTLKAAAGGTLNLGGGVTAAGLGFIDGSVGTVNLTGALDDTASGLTLNGTTGSWNLAGGTLTGGTVSFAGGSMLNLTAAGGTLSGVTFNGTLYVNNASANAIIQNGIAFGSNSLVLNGQNSTVTFSGTQTLASGNVSLLGTGATLGEDPAANTTLTIAAGVTVTSASGALGTPDAYLVNDGAIIANVPGSTLAINATFTNNGVIEADAGTVIAAGSDFTAAPGSELNIGLPSPSEPAGLLSVTGGANLDGTLDLIPAAFTPEPVPFSILTSALTTGQFASVVGSSQPGATYTPNYTGTDVTLVQMPTTPTPDLHITGPNYTPGTYQPGDHIAVSGVGTNDGSLATGDFSITLSLSPSPNGGTPSDVVIFTGPEASFAPGETRLLSADAVVPDSTPAGRYYLVGSDTSPKPLQNQPPRAMPALERFTAMPDIIIAPKAAVPPPTKVGGLDPSFGNQGVASHNVGFTRTADVALQPDGKSVIVGTVGSAGGEDFGITRYNADGSIDTTFGTSGITATDLGGDDQAMSVAILPDGKILVAGTSTRIVNGTPDGSRFAVARYNPDGSLDTTFGGGTGFVLTSFSIRSVALSNDSAYALAVAANGSFFVGGSSDAAGRGKDFAVAAYHADGSPVTSFGVGGKALVNFTGGDDVCRALAVAGDGKIVAVGSSQDKAGDAPEVALARLLPNGATDKSFATRGGRLTRVRGVDDEAESVAVDPQGGILVGGLTAGGSASDGTLTTDFLLARYTPDGASSRTFGTNGVVITSFNQPSAVTRVLFQPGGKIVASGRTAANLANLDSTQLNLAVARYGATGVLDPTFNGTGREIITLNADAPTVTSARRGRVSASRPPGRSGKPTVGDSSSSADLKKKFAEFEQSTQGALASNQGGELLDVGNSGTDTAEASIVTSGIDLSAAVSTTLGASALVGAKASALVQITEAATAAVSQNVTITLLASTSPQGSGAITLATYNQHVSLRQGQTQVSKASFSLPASLPSGTYYVEAHVDTGTTFDLNAANNTAVSAAATHVSSPFVDLSGSALQPAGAIVRGKPTKVSFAVTNNGNVTAKTTTSVEFLASPDGMTADAIPLQTLPLKLKLNAGATGGITEKLTAPASLARGNHYLLAVLDPANTLNDPNLSNNLIASATPLAFS